MEILRQHKTRPRISLGLAFPMILVLTHLRYCILYISVIYIPIMVEVLKSRGQVTFCMKRSIRKQLLA